FPDTALVIPVSFTVITSGAIEEEITATFKEAMVPVSVRKDFGFVTVESEVSRKETLALGLGNR
ncbi:MAG: hypothetical protein IH628_18260, partial [Proteobacteria bacterium]|nr:hypothetical protein [Pseudomonadota bacterium]